MENWIYSLVKQQAIIQLLLLNKIKFLFLKAIQSHNFQNKFNKVKRKKQLQDFLQNTDNNNSNLNSNNKRRLLMIKLNVIVIVMDFHMGRCLLVIIHFVRKSGFIMNALEFNNHHGVNGTVRIVSILERLACLIIKIKKIKQEKIMGIEKFAINWFVCFFFP